MQQITNYQEFLKELRKAGVSMSGDNDEGIFTLCDQFGEQIKWHTNEQETDPWEWRMRVLKEQSDIAYGKLFFGKGGFITSQWFPYLYVVRRGGKELEQEYQNGTISAAARRIYTLLKEEQELPVHKIKEMLGFGKGKEERPAFDSAIVELQMKLYILPFGEERKIAKSGEPYGWPAIVYGLSENFFDPQVITEANKLSYETAYHQLDQQLLLLNQEAKENRRKKFILGE
ncbi:MAG: hypothetical protein Q4G58_12280 [bacterium]|nr:hypothetical protein [bacterium]